MKNKKVGIVLLLVVIIVIIFVIITVSNKSQLDTIKFEHKDISSLNLTKYYGEDYEVNMDAYWGATVPKVGAYYVAKLYYPNNTIIIEENIIKYKDVGTDDGPIVESMIYSEQTLKKEYVIDYINQIHDSSSCGAYLKKFKNLKDNYYYIKYRIPEDC